MKLSPWFALVLLTSAAAASADWTQWRGANRDGLAPTLEGAAEWPDELTQVWRVDGVGAGYAGPLIQGDDIWLHSRLGDDEVVTRRRLSDGGVIWTRKYPAPYEPVNVAAPHGKGPKSTPVLADGRLFTLGITGVLSAFDAESGDELWRKDFADEFSPTWPTFGVAMSPAIFDDKLIAHVGTDKDGALIAFEPATGEEIWRWDGDGPGYSSPILTDVAGYPTIVTQSAEHIIGVRPSDGDLLWSLPFETPYTQNILTPVTYNDALLFSGTRAKTIAVEVDDDDGRLVPEVLWSTTGSNMYMSSPVLVDGVVYGFTERNSGALFAMDPENGEVLWMGPGRTAHNATILAGNGFLLALTSDAELIIYQPDSKQYAPLKTYTIAESETYGQPAVAGPKRLLIKDDRALTLWRWD